MEFASREAYYDYWRPLPAFPADAWGPWVYAYLDYDLGGAEPHLRPRASDAAIEEAKAGIVPASISF